MQTEAIEAAAVQRPHFLLLDATVDTRSIRAELLANEPAWGLNTTRQRTLACQRETESIFLRAGWRADDAVKLEDSQEVRDAPASALFPATMAWLRQAASVVGGELGRALFARLRPQGQVYRHYDAGSYYACRRRYHLVIASPQGSPLVCGEQQVVMREGQWWEFDNKRRHEAHNPGDAPRIHLIFDVRVAADAQEPK
jgi:hypothetical protein